jgi:hypothetical protein
MLVEAAVAVIQLLAPAARDLGHHRVVTGMNPSRHARLAVSGNELDLDLGLLTVDRIASFDYGSVERIATANRLTLDLNEELSITHWPGSPYPLR